MATARSLPLWRSLLFVPVNVEKFVATAHTRDVDGIQLDLEDSVPVSEKDTARKLIEAAVPRVARGGADVVVRINRPLALAVRDIEAAVLPGVAALALPKVTGADHIRLLSELVGDCERTRGMAEGSVKFIAMVETANAYFHMRDIASANPRVVAMTLGAEDFATSVGMLPEPDGLISPNIEMVIAAAAAGILPMGFVGSIAEISDMAAFRATIRRARKLGFRGASCIHPRQAVILNEEFAPGADEVADARRVIAAHEAAANQGRGAISLDGRMIDVPIVERAKATVAWADAIAARLAKRAAAGTTRD
ncbi:MAG: CoA ester lyase [Alphaproteobacteria bacterium]|nr:CoA ester lyase [Alphaproteobacteria bacterium]